MPTTGTGRNQKKDFHLQQAAQFFSAMDYPAALLECERAQVEAPTDPDIYYQLGIIEQRLQHLDNARQHFEKAIHLSPTLTHAHAALGSVYLQEHANLQAIECFKKALASRDCHQTYCNLATSYKNIGLFADAIKTYQRALQLEPNDPVTKTNLAIVNYLVGKYDEAEALYIQVLKDNPDYPTANYNYGQLLLLQGRYEEGWQYYDYRHQLTTLMNPVQLNKPYQGETLINKTLYIKAEQGLGDSLKDAQFLEHYIRRAKKIICQVPEKVIPLLKSNFPAIEFISEKVTVANFDYDIPYSDLPRWISKAEFQCFRPYLQADPSHVARIRQRYQAGSNKLLVGLAWKTLSPGFGHTNIPLVQYIPLLEDPNIQIVNLQYGDISEDLESLPTHLREKIYIDKNINQMRDFVAHTEQIAALDLVISISSTAGVIAAALGVETWITLPVTPLHIWRLAENKSPWFPKAKLFRQKEAAVWNDVISNLQEALNQKHSEKKLRLLIDISKDDAPYNLQLNELGQLLQLKNTEFNITSGSISAEEISLCEKLFACRIRMHHENELPKPFLLLTNKKEATGSETAANETFLIESKQNIDETFRYLIDKYQNIVSPNNLFQKIQSHLAQGIDAYHQADYARAEREYLSIIELDPQHADAWNLLSLNNFSQKVYSEACKNSEMAIAAFPYAAEYYFNYANALAAVDNVEAAIMNYTHALNINPRHDRAYNNLADVYHKLGEYEIAADYCKRALEINPNNDNARCNLGNHMQELGYFNEAIQLFNALIEKNPQWTRPYYNRAFSRILIGEYTAGLDDYEARLIENHYNLGSIPLWQGEATSSLLIRKEQGLGDQIIYAGFFNALPIIENITCECDERLLSLFREQFPQIEFVIKADNNRHYDHQIYAGSLAHRLGLDKHQYANYLTVPKNKLLQGSLNQVSDKRKVGIAWTTKHHKYFNKVSIPLEKLAPLIQANHISFINLQYGEQESLKEETQTLPIHYLNDLNITQDIYGLAQLIQELDEVVCIDNITLALAIALGKPIYGLLGYVPHHWWVIQKNVKCSDKIKLFRQPMLNDWDTVINEVSKELHNDR